MVAPRAITVLMATVLMYVAVVAAVAAATTEPYPSEAVEYKDNDDNRLDRLTMIPNTDQQPPARRFRHEASAVKVLYQTGLCEPIKMLPKCRYFRDMAWTLRSEGNETWQTVHCHCPKGSVTYLLKRLAYLTEDKQIGYQYSFACSPQSVSRLRCQRKEPCRLFTVRKRQEMVDEVNTNTLCQCPPEHDCPGHHTDAGVIQSKNYSEESIRTYSGYCMPPPGDSNPSPPAHGGRRDWLQMI